jgi:hypothetical protein
MRILEINSSCFFRFCLPNTYIKCSFILLWRKNTSENISLEKNRRELSLH